MNEHHNIIDNIFNLLAIATSVAAFVPALVYSYFTTFSNKMVGKIIMKNGIKKSNESDNKWVKRIVGFSHSIDLILVLIIIVIFFTSVFNLILYVYSQVHVNPPKLEILSVDHLLSLLVIWSFIFLFSSIGFWIYTIFKTAKWVHREFWWYRWMFIIPLFLFVIIHSIILCWFSLRLCKGEGNIMDNELIMVSSSTIMIIGSIVLWIIPIVVYRPLFTEIDKALEIFNPPP